MANIPPKTNRSSDVDLLTIIQNGVTKTISKADFLNILSANVTSLLQGLNSTNKKLATDTLPSTLRSLNSTLSVREPGAPTHATTKNYVDTAVSSSIRDLKNTTIRNTLNYNNSNLRDFKDSSLIDKLYVDENLRTTLKTLTPLISEAYPYATAGDTFLIQNFLSVFAEDGPEVQQGDILICVETSSGGSHGAVGHQFAIINTNVVFSTESTAGILRLASEEELDSLDTNDSAISPFKYKRALEKSSEYNRTIVTTPTYTLIEEEKGIIGVDCRKNAVKLTLPAIGRLNNPSVTKFIFKDEYSNSLKNNITLVAGGGDTVQGARNFLINSDGASVKLYNDGADKWYLESNVTAAAGTSTGVKNFITDNTTTGERVSATGAYESVMTIDIDLREYPIGSAFKLTSHYALTANSNTKTVAFNIDGTQYAISTSAVAAPVGGFGRSEITVFHSDTAKTIASGQVHIRILAGTQYEATSISNTIDLDWDQIITVAVDVNAATATSDINMYAFQVIPMK